MHGIIKWYNSHRGFGVIEPYDGSREILFHNVFALPDGTTPEPGMCVNYDENGEPDLNGRSRAVDLSRWSPK